MTGRLALSQRLRAGWSCSPRQFAQKRQFSRRPKCVQQPALQPLAATPIGLFVAPPPQDRWCGPAQRRWPDREPRACRTRSGGEIWQFFRLSPSPRRSPCCTAFFRANRQSHAGATKGGRARASSSRPAL